MSNTLYIVMPTYNEEKNIENVVQEWYPILKCGDIKSKLVIADGGSTDNTYNLLLEMKKKYPNLEVISKPGTDHGTKVIFLYKYAIKNGADWIFQTDSDGQTLPSEFNLFWSKKDSFDVILGNRKKRGDGLKRKLVENTLRLYLKIFFGVWVPDANAPFRLMKSDVVNKYLELFPSNFNLPNAILSALFVKFNEKTSFKVITFRQRQGGKNFMNMKKIFRIGLESIQNFKKIRNNLNKYDNR